MMFSSRSFGQGQHVIASRDITRILGNPIVRTGACGCVIATPTGWFNDDYLVEFNHSRTIRVKGKDLKPALFGVGQASWRKYQQTRQGIVIGLFVVFGLPELVGLVRYFLAGGTSLGLVLAIPDAVLGTLADAVPILGLPVTVLLLVIWWAKRRRRP